ncbi:hypothetical protein ITP53_53490, partial [Nonomuraea sp. K274]
MRIVAWLGRLESPAFIRGERFNVQYTAHAWDGRQNRLADSTFNRGTPAALPMGRLSPALEQA